VSENKAVDLDNSTAVLKQEKPPVLVNDFGITNKDGKLDSIAIDKIEATGRAKKKQAPKAVATLEEEQLQLLQDSAASQGSGTIDTQNSEADDETLDRFIVTGAKIRMPDLETPVDIQKLEDLIIHKHFTEAKKLLKELKEKYPDYDFSQLEKLIK
jgi:hypothetical protein